MKYQETKKRIVLAAEQESYTSEFYDGYVDVNFFEDEVNRNGIKDYTHFKCLGEENARK